MNNFFKVCMLLLISSCCIAQPEMSLWWVSESSGNAISKHQSDHEGPVLLKCGMDIDVKVGDNPSDTYELVYHILNEGDEVLVIDDINLGSVNSAFDLYVYGLSFPISVNPNEELEFIINYHVPSPYTENSSSFNIESNDEDEGSCSTNIKTGLFTLCDPSTDENNTSFVGSTEEILEALANWTNNILPCAAPTFLPELPCSGNTTVSYNCCFFEGGTAVVSESTTSLKSMDEDCDLDCPDFPYVFTVVVGDGGVNQFPFGCSSCSTFSWITAGEDCGEPVTINITDPCSCDNTLNFVLGGFLHFEDKVTVNSSAIGGIVLLDVTDGKLLDNTGAPYPVGTPFTETAPGVYELQVWTKANDPAQIEVSINGITMFPDDADKFTTESDCNCTTAEPIPTMGEWGLMSLGILLLIFGVVTIKQRQLSFN